MPVTSMREAFYVGGRYVKDETGKHTMQGQMYVERLVAAPDEHRAQNYTPMVFLHGGTRTGAVSSSLYASARDCLKNYCRTWEADVAARTGSRSLMDSQVGQSISYLGATLSTWWTFRTAQEAHGRQLWAT